MHMAGADLTDYAATVAAISGPHPEKLGRLSWVGYKQPEDPVCTLYAGLNTPGGEEAE
jgi:hypothetical protein